MTARRRTRLPRTMATPLLSTLPTLLLVCACLRPAEAYKSTIDYDDGINGVRKYDLQQAHVITRHGARAPLTKHSYDLLETDGVPLTSRGAAQMYALGQGLRDHYGDTFFGSYSPFDHKFESSHLDRTLTSANALALGLFGSDFRPQNDFDPALYAAEVPVYSTREDNDVTIRAYKNCPVFNDRLKELYASPSWLTMEMGYVDLLKKYAQHFPQFIKVVVVEEIPIMIVMLENLWNVYDAIHFIRTECTTSDDACDAVINPQIAADMTDAEWEMLERITHKVEYEKYGVGNSDNLLGSNLLRQILTRIEDGKGKLYHYSAHYPTIIGLMATMNLPVVDDPIPDYAAAFVIEVYAPQGITAPKYVRIVYEARPLVDISATNVATQLTLEKITLKCPDETDTCSLDAFQTMLSQTMLPTVEDWCDACQNTVADVCIKKERDALKAAASNDVANDKNIATSPASNDDKQKFAVAIVLSLFGGIMLGILLTMFVTPKLHVSKSTVNVSDEKSVNDLEMTPSEPGSSGVMG